MLPAQRLKRVLNDLMTRGAVTIGDLSERYGVSEMTIRRDLKVLEEQGYAQRTHGGAVRVGPATEDPPYHDKLGQHAAPKAAIARCASENVIRDGDILILEGGTTVTALIPHLADHKNLTIMTNSLYTLNALRRQINTHTIIVTGGILREPSYTFVGPLAEATFAEFHANKVVLSATGWTADHGFTDPGMLDTQVKKAMIRAVDQVIMLIDSSKFGNQSLTAFLAPFDADIIITDAGAPPEVIARLKENGVEVLIAP